MIKLSKFETGEVQNAIDRAVARMVRLYPVLRTEAQDIAQDAWIKFLAGYSRDRDVETTVDLRLAREAQDQATSKYRTAESKEVFVDRGDLRPGAFAYTVATTIAIDYARNRKGKLRMADAALSLDTPIKSAKNEATDQTLADTLAAALDDAPIALGARDRAAAVQRAIATLSDSGREAIEAWLNDQTMTGSQRIAKMRAIEQIQETISASL